MSVYLLEHLCGHHSYLNYLQIPENQQDKCPDIYSKTCPDNNPMEKQKIQKYTKMSEYVETLVLFRTFFVQFSSKKLSAYMMMCRLF